MSPPVIPKEKYSTITGWMKLWEAAALLFFLLFLQSPVAKSLKARDPCFIYPDVPLVGDAPNGTRGTHGVDKPLC